LCPVKLPGSYAIMSGWPAQRKAGRAGGATGQGIISKKIDTFVVMNTKIDTRKIEKISKALGDPYRIKIMEAIKKEPDWMQCNTIIEMFNLAQSTVSHHLKQLVDADLLHYEKDGRCSRYKINKEAFGEYVAFLKLMGG